MSPTNPRLRVQINQIDYVLAPPQGLDKSSLPLVPVLRIFGPSSMGVKSCVHVHQVYPYFYVEYVGKLDPISVKKYCNTLTFSLNHAIAISLKQNPKSSKSRYIRSIFLVKGVKFYGFHSSYTPFLKVLVSNPGLSSRIVSILQSGSIMKTRFTVFESHLSFILQFFADFGLYGCGWLDLGTDIYKRSNCRGPENEETSSLETSACAAESRMPLEIDVIAHQILNRHLIVARNVHHELNIGDKASSNEPLVLSVRELWDQERSRRLALGLDSSPELPIDPSETSRAPHDPWIAEARWWDELRIRIEQENGEIAMDDDTWSTRIMTTFESIEALWEDEWRTWKPIGAPVLSHDIEDEILSEDTKIDIDLEILSSQDRSFQAEEEELIQSMETEDLHPILDERSDDEQEYIDDDYQESIHSNTEEEQESVSIEPSTTTTTKDASISQNSYGKVDELFNTSSNKTEGALSKMSTSENTRISMQVNRKSIVRIASSSTSDNAFCYSLLPPSITELRSSMDTFSVYSMCHQDPFYSFEEDTSENSWEFGGLQYHVPGAGLDTVEPWQDSNYQDTVEFPNETPLSMGDISSSSSWEFAGSPPTLKQTRSWLKRPRKEPVSNSYQRSQIEGPTQPVLSETKLGAASSKPENMTILNLEIFAPSYDDRLPDSGSNEIVVVFYCFQLSDISTCINGAIALNDEQMDPPRIRDMIVENVDNELDLINRVVDLVIDLDPDILVGWDVQNFSWGYLGNRAAFYGFDLVDMISRAPVKRIATSEQWETRTTSTFKVTGRQILNIWRIMRSELSLTSDTFENVAFHVLNYRIPRYSNTILTTWYYSDVPLENYSLLRYYMHRALVALQLLSKVDIVTKTEEFSRVFGVDFNSVISRGSQFKVEAFMFRIAKPESFVLISPSKLEVGKQNAAECMPLIMEPGSALFSSPMVILDFQSLYPSVMIAYNYCYSTCLGRITDFQGRNKLGVIDLRRPPGLLNKLQHDINIAPNGMVFVKSEVRKGLLGRMLIELLETRVMIKQAMKSLNKGQDKTMLRILEARQLGLKYIANVTYGYTSASYSGRMPAVEIADSIVQTGRETLEKAIQMIHDTEKWKAKVVYGDTDSLFIYLKGRTKAEAFRIGQEIADTITAQNPAPIKMKFEKVYLPSVLLAKKRYVGFKYENVDDLEPIFDAKGIETIRRDGILAQRKMVEKCLKILFRTKDLSQVKDYCWETWTKILKHKIPIYDFIFSKEVRLGTYSDKVAPPPGASVAARRMVRDPNDEPQYGERVPYVITEDSQGSRLVDRAMDPLEMLEATDTRLDAHYYISRVLLPPLERIFNIVGANVKDWFVEMSKAQEEESVARAGGEYDTEDLNPPIRSDFNPVELDEAICDDVSSPACLICGFDSEDDQAVCEPCLEKMPETFSRVLSLDRSRELRLLNAYQVCRTCEISMGCRNDYTPIECNSVDCPWMFERRRAEQALEVASTSSECEEVEEEEGEEERPDGANTEDSGSQWSTSDKEGELPNVPPSF